MTAIVLRNIILLIVILPTVTIGTELTDTKMLVSLLSSDAESVSLGFEMTDVEKSISSDNGETFTTHFIPDAGMTLEPGRPQLPAVTRFVVVPPDAGLELIIETSEPRRISADHPPLICTEEGLPEPNDPYDRYAIYPPVIAKIGDPVVIRGVRLVTVTTYPVRYDPASDSYLYYDNIQTNIQYNDSEPINPAIVPVRKNRSPEFLKFLRSIAINADEVGRDDPDEDSPYVGHCLVVAHENCIEYAAPFIEWRRQSGWKMDYLSLPSNIAGSFNSVKNRIQDVYDEYLEDEVDPFDHIFIIGDLPNNLNHGPGVQWVVGTQSWHGDWFYACLEGNDNHADVGISRWFAGSPSMLELHMLRTWAYEVEPYMEDTEWFTRGAVYAQNWARNYHISLATNVRWGVQVLESLGFDDIRVDINMEQNDAGGQRVGAFIRDQYNDGTNVMIGRAENYLFRTSLPGVEPNVIFPIDIYLGGHQEHSAYELLRRGTPNQPTGPVAVTSSFGNPSTIINSLLWLEIVNGFLQHDLTFGWSLLKGLIAPVEYFPGFENIAQNYRTITGFFGDPALQYWRGVPMQVQAEFDEVISPYPRYYSVTVTNNQGAVENAQVSLYAPGERPEFDDEDYVEYGDMQMWTAKTDINGEAQFLFDNVELVEDTPFLVTVTGRDILPLMQEARIETQEAEIQLDQFEIVEIEGNGDNDPNPGETITVVLTAINIGDQDSEDITASVTTESPWIQIENNNAQFGSCEPNQSVASEDSIFIHIGASCPNGESQPSQQPILKVRFTDGDNSWNSWLKITPVSPDFEVLRVVGGDQIPNNEQEREFDLHLKNVGELDADDVTVKLVSLDFGISVIQDGATFPPLQPNRSSRVEGEPFRIKGRAQAFPGSDIDMLLICRLGNGFIDSCLFTLQIGEPVDDGPMGPDGFGYYCLDDTDEDWVTSPRYNWIEISRLERDRDYNGREFDFDGNSPMDIGETQVVDLGFVTQFYGNEYDQITVCTNGYILMGDQEFGINFQNWPLDRGFGTGCGVIAPFWDWLNITDDSHVYYYHDEEEGRFIVEWYKMRHKVGGDGDLTFQAIIYDQEVQRTLTGNQTILFQYKTISDVRGGGNWTDQVPYASVGISSPDGTTGISYLFNDTYPDGAVAIEEDRAILFTTDLAYSEGILYGNIFDLESGDPVEGAYVETSFGYNTLTDRSGKYYMPDIPAEILQTVSVFVDGYNDTTVTLTNDMLLEGDSLELSFDLLHATFTPSSERFWVQLDPEFEWEHQYTITNNGNGPLYWQMEKHLPNNADVDPWEFRQSFAVGDTTGDSRISGVVWTGDRFFCTGGGRSRVDDNFVYELDRHGNLINQFQQFGDSRYGMSDLAWDGGLIWGGEESTVYGFSTDGELQESFNTSLDDNQTIAWDEDRQLFWIADKLSDHIYGYDRDGNEQSQLRQMNFMIYGLGYWPDDPDGHPLYIYHNIVVVEGPDLTLVHKMDPETGDTMFVADLGTEEDGKPEGAFITNTFDVYSWVFMSIANVASHDRIDLWQLDARMDWFNLSVNDQDRSSGIIEPRQTEDFLLGVNSYELPTVPFEGYFLFKHNAIGGSDTLHIELDVIPELAATPFDLISPEDGELINGNERDVVQFSWEESYDPNWGDSVSYELWIKSEEDSANFGSVDTASFSLELSELNLQFGESADSLEWWVLALSDPDTTESTDRFTIRYLPNSREMNTFNPVQFGLREIFPQPFNGSMTVKFGLETRGDTSLDVFDLSGRKVTTLINGVLQTGKHQAVWRAHDLPSGMYVIRLESAGRVESSKAVLVK